jgi:hypothetical protein
MIALLVLALGAAAGLAYLLLRERRASSPAREGA